VQAKNGIYTVIFTNSLKRNNPVYQSPYCKSENETHDEQLETCTGRTQHMGLITLMSFKYQV